MLAPVEPGLFDRAAPRAAMRGPRGFLGLAGLRVERRWMRFMRRSLTLKSEWRVSCGVGVESVVAVKELKRFICLGGLVP